MGRAAPLLVWQTETVVKLDGTHTHIASEDFLSKNRPIDFRIVVSINNFRAKFLDQPEQTKKTPDDQLMRTAKGQKCVEFK